MAAPGPIEHGTAPFSAPLPDRLRAVTFNIEYRTRAAPLAQALRTHPELARADVLLLQEIESYPAEGASRASMVAAALGMSYVSTHGLAILSRWPLHQPQVTELPREKLPFRQRRRIALTADLHTAAGPLRLTTVHLDTRINYATRMRQLAPAVAGAHPLQIVGGDMNTLPFHFAGRALPVFPADQARQLDAYMRGLGFATPVCDVGATHRHFLRVRLDAIFTRGFTPSVGQVARDVHLSDHHPVWVDLAMP